VEKMRFNIHLLNGKETIVNLPMFDSVQALVLEVSKLQSGNFLILGDNIAVAKDSITMIEKIEKLD